LEFPDLPLTNNEPERTLQHWILHLEGSAMALPDLTIKLVIGVVIKSKQQTAFYLKGCDNNKPETVCQNRCLAMLSVPKRCRSVSI